jgi:hypothetical protein
MQLSDREMKSVERLRKAQQLWPRVRWLLLGLGILICGISVWLQIFALNHLLPLVNERDNRQLFLMVVAFAVVWLKCLVVFAIGAWFIVWSIRDWNGNVNRMLLLKLLDDRWREPGEGGDAKP